MFRNRERKMANEKMDNLNRTGADRGNTCLNWGNNFNPDVFWMKAWTEAQRRKGTEAQRGKNFVPLCLYF
jgi:hypothetical protein